ncbi:MAG: SDR family oxidoreductase [Paracoccus sp. (in: a-proteobacteria)]|jgi:NAD(P)-dependent dehydrogenase (short-subunit alcohol dehydrogenase family)
MRAAGQRVALVSGVSSGIGRQIAQALLAQGWQVIGLSRRAPEPGHPNLRHIAVDLSDAKALETALAGIGPLDAIVHAAGVLRVGTVGALDPANGEAMWRLHVMAAERIVNTLVPGLADGGRIVLIGSRTAAGSAGRSQYAATKAALVGMARSWAIELAPRGICVNVVAPAATDTPMLKDPARAGVQSKLPPMGRLVQPDEVAGLTAFLLGDAARSITGQQIVVCAGSSL